MAAHNADRLDADMGIALINSGPAVTSTPEGYPVSPLLEERRP